MYLSEVGAWKGRAQPDSTACIRACVASHRYVVILDRLLSLSRTQNITREDEFSVGWIRWPASVRSFLRWLHSAASLQKTLLAQSCLWLRHFSFVSEYSLGHLQEEPADNWGGLIMHPSRHKKRVGTARIMRSAVATQPWLDRGAVLSLFWSQLGWKETNGHTGGQ
jgi:hypothetical protein